MSNFIEPDSNSYELANKFPHDDIVVSMVAMTQLIKKLLKNYHAQQQQQHQHQQQQLQQKQQDPESKDRVAAASNKNVNNTLLTRLFYLLIEIYEHQMHHPNDVLNPAKSNSISPMHLTGIFFNLEDNYRLRKSIHFKLKQTAQKKKKAGQFSFKTSSCHSKLNNHRWRTHPNSPLKSIRTRFICSCSISSI